MKRCILYVKGILAYRRAYRACRAEDDSLDPTKAQWLASWERFIVYGQHYPGSRSWRKHALHLWEGNMERARQRWLASEGRK